MTSNNCTSPCCVYINLCTEKMNSPNLPNLFCLVMHSTYISILIRHYINMNVCSFQNHYFKCYKYSKAGPNSLNATVNICWFLRLSDDLVEMFDTVFCFSTGRFDETVIEERRQSALNLLKFVGGHHYLYNSKDFKAFIKVWIHSTLYRSKELKDLIKVEIQTTLYKSKVLKDFIVVGIPNIVFIWGASM